MRSLLILLLLCPAVFAAEPPLPLPDLTRGGVIELEAGDYEATGDYSPRPNRPLVLRGKGPGITRIKLTGKAQSFLKIAGRVNDGKLTRNSRWILSNLTIDGDDREAHGVILENASAGIIENVIFEDFKGSAMTAEASWDCYFSNVRFVRSGTKDHPAFLAKDATTDPPTRTNVNNFVFVGCIWENHNGTHLYIGSGATKNRFLGCKWHGKLPTPSPDDHIHCAGTDNAWASCNFTNCGGSQIVMLKGAQDNSFAGSHIGNSQRYGIELNGTENNLEGIVWTKAGGRNRLGDVKR